MSLTEFPTTMSPEIRKLYLFHFFLSMALAVVSSFLFIDKILLRMGLNMSQFGVIKGLAFLGPVTLNLLLAPYLTRWGRDRHIVVSGYLLRVAFPYLLLVLPQLTEDTRLLTLGSTIVLLVTMVFPTLANNSISALCKAHIPRERLGHHMAHIVSLWTVPGFLLAIPCGWYIDRYGASSDPEFYRAFLHVLLATTIFVLPAGWVMLRLSRLEKARRKLPRLGYRDIREPFANKAFRVYLNASFMLSLVSMMIIAFINPYLFRARGLSLLQVSLITTMVTLMGVGLRPLWGQIADHFGGKNILRVSVVGVAVALLFLTGEGLLFIVIFALLAWNTNEGLFGVGVFTGQRYLNLALSDEEKANIYIAATTFVNGVGMFCGSFLGGFLLDWLAVQIHPDLPYSHYRIYFTYCALAYLIVGQFVVALRERRRRVSSAELALAMYRRSIRWRGQR